MKTKPQSPEVKVAAQTVRTGQSVSTKQPQPLELKQLKQVGGGLLPKNGW